MRSQEDLDRLGARVATPSPEQSTIDRDTLDHLAKAIAALPGKTREAFILRRVEGLSQREIARRMGLSENTVEKHISRGLRLLVDQLARDGDAPGGRRRAKD